MYVGGNIEYIFHEEYIAIKRANKSLVNNPRPYMHTSEFHSYHTVILLPDLDFVANEHIYLMR